MPREAHAPVWLGIPTHGLRMPAHLLLCWCQQDQGCIVQTQILLIAVWLLMPSSGEEPDAAGICLSADVLKKKGRKNSCGPFHLAGPLKTTQGPIVSARGCPCRRSGRAISAS